MPSRKNHHELFRLSALIAGFLSESLSEQEEQELQSWIAEQENHRILFEKICAEETMKEQLDRYRSGNAYPAFLRFAEKRKQRALRRRLYRWSACAAVALLLGGAWWQWQTVTGTEGNDLPLAQSTAAEEPDRRPVLVLATGERLVVPEGRLAFEETAEGQRVMSDNELIATHKNDTQEGENEYYTMEVPPKCDFHFVMSDGTKVWMNAASTMRYPVKFAADARRVYAEGEIYLEVAKDARRPFYVELESMEIAVLGTSFNVRAYRQEQEIQVTLAEGKVAARTAQGKAHALTPGNRLSLAKHSGEVSVEAVEVEDVLAWKRGVYIFKKSTLKEVASTLKHWYNADIRLAGEQVARQTYTGVVNKEEPLDTFLKRLEEVSEVRCEQQGNLIIIQES